MFLCSYKYPFFKGFTKVNTTSDHYSQKVRLLALRNSFHISSVQFWCCSFLVLHTRMQQALISEASLALSTFSKHRKFSLWLFSCSSMQGLNDIVETILSGRRIGSGCHREVTISSDLSYDLFHWYCLCLVPCEI